MSAPYFPTSVWLRRTLWAGGGVLLLSLAAWLVLPPVVKSLIEAQASAALGRTVTVGRVAFNPWSLELTLTELAVARAPGDRHFASGPQFAIDRLRMDAEWESLWRMAPVLAAVELDGPVLHLARRANGQSDLDDVVKRLSAASQEPSAQPPRFALHNVVVNEGAVYLTGAQKHTLRHLHLALPELSTLDAAHEAAVAPRLALELDGSHWESSAKVSALGTAQGEARLTIQGLNLAPFLAYLPQSLPVQVRSARLNAELGIHFAQAPKRLGVNGWLSLSALQLDDAAGAPWLQAQALRVELADVRPLERRFMLGTVELFGPRLQVQRLADGNLAFATKLEALYAHPVSSEGPKSIQATAPWQLGVERLALREGAVAWTDDSTQPPANLALTELELQAKGLRWPSPLPAPAGAKAAGTPATDTTFSGSARLGSVGLGSASLALKGLGTVSDGHLQASVDDLPLALGAPYLSAWLQPRLVGAMDGQLELAWSPKGLQISAPLLTLRDAALLPARVATTVNAASTGPAARSSSAERAAAELPTIKRLEVRDATLDWVGKNLRVGKLALTAPAAMLHRASNGQWSFTRWIKPQPEPTAAAESDTAPPATASAASAPVPSWKLSVGELALDNARLRLDDRSTPRPVRLEASDLQLRLQELTQDGSRPLALALRARIQSGRTEPGTLAYSGTLAWAPLVLQGRLQASDLPLHALLPYLAVPPKVELLRCDTSFSGQLRYASTPAGAELEATGDAALKSLLVHSAGSELLRWKLLSLPGVVLQLAPTSATRLEVREAVLSDFFAHVELSSTGRINLQDLLPTAAAAPEATASGTTPLPAKLPAVLKLGLLRLENGAVQFEDHFIRPNYSADVRDLNGTLGAFSSHPADGLKGAVQLADLDLHGRVEGSATLSITGRINPLVQPLALDIRAHMRDLELPPLSAYSVKYAGYGIERGKLSVDLHYRVQPDGELTASNNIVLRQLAFGDPVQGSVASLPLRLAAALLADGDGVIDINLPVQGSLNDPEFSLGEVIGQVFLGMVGKAVTAPFSLLASALGGAGQRELSQVPFAAGSSALGVQAAQRLDAVAKALLQRSTLVLTVVGKASLAQERQALQAQQLQDLLQAERRRSMLGSVNNAPLAPSANAEDDAEYHALLRAVFRRADIPKPRNALGLPSELPETEMREMLLQSLDIGEDAGRELAQQRADAVKAYLAASGVPDAQTYLGAVRVEPLSEPTAAWAPHVELSLSQR